MASKNIGRILSGGAIVLCVILFCSLSISGQQFRITKVTFKISGSVGLSGVAMTGLPGNVVTDENGYYSATVEYDWSGKVTPERAGYTFNPPFMTYNNVKSNYENQNYTFDIMKFTISGSAGQPGVMMTGLPGSPVSGSDGTYKATVEYGWSGSVTPDLIGYTFTPPSKAYTQVNRDYTNENYKADPITFTISGSVGQSGVVMKGLPKPAVSDPSGNYSAVVPYGWSGTVTPEKEGFIFNPINRPYANIISAQSYQDYIPEAITFTISGSAEAGGVTMKGLLNDPVTNPDGTYISIVPYNFTAKVTPQKPGYTFKPPEMTYSKVTRDFDNQSYKAVPITYTISGSVGQPGVVMTGLLGNPVSGADNTYRAVVPYDWSGTVTPDKQGYTFTPDRKTYPRVTADLANENYAAAAITFAISGTTGVAGVVMKGFPGSVVTDEKGNYNVPVQYGWSGTVTLESEAYTFKPPNKPYLRITREQTNQDYTAEVVMLTISGTLSVGGMPLEGVPMAASEGGVSGTTDAKGHWSVKVPYGWSGEISPKKEGYNFDPPSIPYTNVTTNYVDGAPVARQPAPKPPTTTPPTTTPPVTKPPEVKPPEPDITIRGPIRRGPSVDVSPPTPGLEGQFDEQRRLLEGQIGTLQERVDELLRQLSAEPAGPSVPPAVGPSVPPAVGPEVPGAVPPKVPSVVTPKVPPAVPTKVPKVRGGPLVSLVCFDMELREALQVLEAQAGTKIYADDTVKGKVTCQLINRPLEEALAEVLKGTGLAFKEIPNSYLVYKPISNTWVDGELRSVLQDIGTAAGVVIIPDATVSGVVTATLESVSLDTALEIVLAGTGYVVKKTPYYYLVAAAGVEAPAFASVSETRRVKLSYVAANVATGLLSPAFRNYVQADPNAGIVVTAPSALVGRIVSDLKQIDRPPHHVMLDARIVVIERGNLLNLGVEWGWPKLRAGVFGADFRGGGADEMQYHGKWPWGVQMGYTPDAVFTDSLLLTLNLLAQNGEADIVSSPQVLAQDGRQAVLSVMNEEYYFLTAPERVAGWYTEAQLETVTAGTRLTVTPRIGDSNDITLDIAAEVSDVVSRGEQTQQTVPLVTVSRRTATNTVRVKDGGTVAVAGLTENRTVKEDSRAPGLSDIPILGGLFKNTRKQQSSREIAVFITARLVPEMAEMVELAEPAAEQLPPEPVGEEEFRTRLRQSLLRPTR